MADVTVLENHQLSAVEAELSASLRSKSTIFLLLHTDAGEYPIVY